MNSIFCNAQPLLRVSISMKHILALLALIALPALSQAQERTFGNGTLPEFLALYDVDNSGGLSTEELQALQADRKSRRSRLQARWDSDGDGKISNAEREGARTAIIETIERRRSNRFDDVDNDGNGFLSSEEFGQISAVIVADNDSPGLANQIFNNLDLDQDSQVSKEEFLRTLALVPPERDPNFKQHPRRSIGRQNASTTRKVKR